MWLLLIIVVEKWTDYYQVIWCSFFLVINVSAVVTEFLLLFSCRLLTLSSPVTNENFLAPNVKFARSRNFDLLGRFRINYITIKIFFFFAPDVNNNLFSFLFIFHGMICCASWWPVRFVDALELQQTKSQSKAELFTYFSCSFVSFGLA